MDFQIITLTDLLGQWLLTDYIAFTFLKQEVGEVRLGLCEI